MAVLAIPSALCSQVLILHEKLAGSQWVLDVTWLNGPQEIGAAMVDIDADPAKRRGPSLLVLGGTRLNIEQLTIPGDETWQPSEENKGSFVVFWNIVGSSDPANWFYDIFATQKEAEDFITAVNRDNTRELWDSRPLIIDQTFKPSIGENTIEWILKP